MTKRLWKALILLSVLLLLSFFAAACGEKEAGAGEAAGSAERGKELFDRTMIGANAAPGCATCHSLDQGITIVGPPLAGIASRAEEEVPGQPASEYLHESIVEPDAHVVEGFAAGVMYQNYGRDLSGQEIDDLVAYLLTLK
jgi:cytochrome c